MNRIFFREDLNFAFSLPLWTPGPGLVETYLPLLCTKMLCRESLPAHQGKAPARRKQHLHYHLARNFQSLTFQYVFLSRSMGYYTKVLTFPNKNIVFTQKLLI